VTISTENLTKCFTDAFGSEPKVLARAPGRVEVLGNHTDYNEGYTLSCAIDKEVLVAAAKTGIPGPLSLCPRIFLKL